MNELRIGDRVVGTGQPCYLIAEVGINHNGDKDLSRQSIVAAAEAGADAVKFQNYRTEDFISSRDLTYEYVSQGKTVVEPQYDLFKRCELSRDDLVELARTCAEHGVDFISTPTSEEGIADLVAVGAAALKNGSDYLGHLPLIRAMARTGLPTIISTGMATLSDIDLAVEAFRGAGGRDLVILHCVSVYPAPCEDLNLRKIEALAHAFDVPAGFSDHSEGTVAAVVAATSGACVIEKHFTLDKNLPGPDHRFSSDPAEFRHLAASVRFAQTSLGSSRIEPATSEREGRKLHRLSCVAREALTAGHILSEADIDFQRPGDGYPPAMAELLCGRRLARDAAPGHVFIGEDFE